MNGQTATAGRTVRLIAFSAGSEVFTLDIMSIRQILSWMGSTPVPGAPEFVEGIIVLRDEVIPIVDLGIRLLGVPVGSGGRPLVLVVNSPKGTIGIKVDEVLRILTVELDSILPPPPLIKGLRSEWLIGIVEQKDRIHLLLDLESLLTVDERREIQEAIREATVQDVESSEFRTQNDE